MAKKNRDGEYIALFWDYKPDAYYVRGHVSEAGAFEALRVNDVPLDLIGPARHVYARWSTQGDAPEGCVLILREYAESGRGRFKVTAFDVK